MIKFQNNHDIIGYYTVGIAEFEICPPIPKATLSLMTILQKKIAMQAIYLDQRAQGPSIGILFASETRPLGSCAITTMETKLNETANTILIIAGFDDQVKFLN